MNSFLKQKRSPLKGKPLRTPGESLQLQRAHLIDDELLPSLLFATVFVLFAVHEWLQVYFYLGPSPRSISAVAVIAVGYCTYKFIVLRKRSETLRLGLEGERAVGQYLEDLRSRGCRVFHDIVADGFNIDHVVVSPRGIFVIETKTYSKSNRGKGVIEFDGEHILVDGWEPERDAVRQVRALGAWLSRTAVFLTIVFDRKDR